MAYCALLRDGAESEMVGSSTQDGDGRDGDGRDGEALLG